MFRDRLNQIFPAASSALMGKLYAFLSQDFGINSIQITESVAYSFAMVARAALGLNAADSKVLVIYQDSLPGWISLATARHLYNAGCNTAIASFDSNIKSSDTLNHLLIPLNQLKIQNVSLSELIKRDQLEIFLDSFHNVLLGIDSEKSSSHEDYSLLSRELNENKIPVHCLISPLGINRDSGESSADALYASSTLSLGIPYSGLYTARDYVGRHYLADISLPYNFVAEFIGKNFPPLFSEQPVIQIYPIAEEEE